MIMVKSKLLNFINEKNHFKFYVIDITGKRYIYTDKMSIKSFIEDVDEEFEVLENYKTHKYQKL